MRPEMPQLEEFPDEGPVVERIQPLMGKVRPLGRVGGTEKEKSPGDLLQIEGEILTSHVGGWDAGDDVLRAHDFGGGPGGQLRHSGIVEDRGSAPGDGAVRTGAEYGSRCLGHLTDAPGGVLPQTVLQSADGPALPRPG